MFSGQNLVRNQREDWEIIDQVKNNYDAELRKSSTWRSGTSRLMMAIVVYDG